MKLFCKGFTLVELLIISVIMCIIIIPTVDVMSRLFISQADFNNEIQAKQNSLNLTERISTGIREGSYMYPSGTYLMLPSSNTYSTISAMVGDNSIAVLVPQFDGNGNVIQPSNDVTSFKGVAYSIVYEYIWNHGYTGKYVLIETTYDMQLTTDPNDPLLITASPPTDWTSGSSFLLADNFAPASFLSMGSTAFKINNDRTRTEFAFVPKGNSIYYPSSSGSMQVNDIPYITSIGIRNWRKTTF